ncbi:diversity-generating retroelement protein Avd [Candidatus Saganbacteria bacterium]|nr:diversity-generating retroelement protein Avd [Candidatus Saganbacteria bacterium]
MEGPKVITYAYDFIKWAIPHIAKFPRNQRYTLGERIENKLFCLLELLIEAQYSKDKANALKKANLEIEQMRHLFRLCYDLRLINLKTYELSSKYLMDIGAQIGGWIKQQSAR